MLLLTRGPGRRDQHFLKPKYCKQELQVQHPSIKASLQAAAYRRLSLSEGSWVMSNYKQADLCPALLIVGCEYSYLSPNPINYEPLQKLTPTCPLYDRNTIDDIKPASP